MNTLLFHTTWRHANANRWLAEGFEQLGWRVVRVGPKPDDHWMEVGWEHVPHVDVVLDHAAPVPIAALAREHGADLALVWNEAGVHYADIDELHCPLAVYVSEGWPGEFAAAGALPGCIKFTQMPYGVRGHDLDAMRDGWLYLPGACAPQRHPLRGLERDIDVCLLGGEYEWRLDVARGLSERGGLQAVTGHRNVSGYAEVANRSLTMACHTNRQAYIEWRVFEAMAMGAIVLLDDSDPRTVDLLDRLGMLPNRHYMPCARDCEDADVVAGCIRELRADPKYTAEVRADAYALAMTRHTYADRARTVIDAAGLGAHPTFDPKIEIGEFFETVRFASPHKPRVLHVEHVTRRTAMMVQGLEGARGSWALHVTTDVPAGTDYDVVVVPGSRDVLSRALYAVKPGGVLWADNAETAEVRSVMDAAVHRGDWHGMRSPRDLRGEGRALRSSVGVWRRVR